MDRVDWQLLFITIKYVKLLIGPILYLMPPPFAFRKPHFIQNWLVSSPYQKFDLWDIVFHITFLSNKSYDESKKSPMTC